jgi:Lrp/AsnC family leucine-responsive transcriptional regulator
MPVLDAIDRALLVELQRDDQQSLAELSRVVNLAPSSITERIKKLTQSGAISGFHARVPPEVVGLDLLAFVFVGWNDPDTERPFLAAVAREPSIMECHHVTGSWNYLLKVRTRTTRELETFLGSVLKAVPGLQRTETLIVLSSAKETSILPVNPPAWSLAV